MSIMKSKQFLGILAIITVIFISGCIQEEKVASSDKNVSISIDNNEVQHWEIPESLKFCLQKYVYGKEGNWVNIAEDRCEPLLPSGCMFGYGKAAYEAEYLGSNNTFTYNGRDLQIIVGVGSGLSSPSGGKFGVYCPAKFSKDLDVCEKKINWSSYDDPLSGTDGFIIDKIYKNCWESIDDSCMFVNTVREPYYNMFFCLVS